MFLEPEGWTTNEVYVQGCNTSLPEDVQWRMLRSIPALRRVELMRGGYAIEYDAVATGEIGADLGARRLAGLFLAGQINGTSGYEEAAAQGLVAGINAARYAATDPEDEDFSTRRAASKVYGNSKRYLMASCWEYFAQPEVRRQGVTLAVVHPGITYTNITAHYPPWLFTLIKHPMQWIFMSRRRACLSLLQGAFEETGYGEWIGPRWFDVWGLPVKRRVRSLPPEECRRIAATAAAITDRLIDAESTYAPPHS